MQAKIGGTEIISPSLKTEALNCIENLLIREEICIETYDILNKALKLLDCKNYFFDLGEGITLKLEDRNK